MKELDKFKQHKIPEDSLLYNRVIPTLFIAFGIVTIGLVLFAVGIFTGLIAWT